MASPTLTPFLSDQPSYMHAYTKKVPRSEILIHNETYKWNGMLRVGFDVRSPVLSFLLYDDCDKLQTFHYVFI